LLGVVAKPKHQGTFLTRFGMVALKLGLLHERDGASDPVGLAVPDDVDMALKVQRLVVSAKRGCEMPVVELKRVHIDVSVPGPDGVGDDGAHRIVRVALVVGLPAEDYMRLAQLTGNGGEDLLGLLTPGLLVPQVCASLVEPGNERTILGSLAHFANGLEIEVVSAKLPLN